MKNKFIFVYFGMVLLSSALMISCSDDQVVTPVTVPVDSSDFRYPFTDGRTWSYSITTTASDIQPDSILHYFTFNPMIVYGSVAILYDTLINSVLTKCLLDEFTTTGIFYSNRYYYINNDTSLILYAQRQGLGHGLLPLKKIKNHLSNADYDNLISINNNELKFNGDILYSTLKYPMTTGTEWTNEYSFGNVTRKYLGFENINGPNGIISCMKEQYSYSFFPGTYYNYYSKNGLMKTYSFINDIAHTTVNNPDGDGTFDSTTETVITGYFIPSVK